MGGATQLKVFRLHQASVAVTPVGIQHAQHRLLPAPSRKTFVLKGCKIFSLVKKTCRRSQTAVWPPDRHAGSNQSAWRTKQRIRYPTIVRTGRPASGAVKCPCDICHDGFL